MQFSSLQIILEIKYVISNNQMSSQKFTISFNTNNFLTPTSNPNYFFIKYEVNFYQAYHKCSTVDPKCLLPLMFFNLVFQLIVNV